MTVLEQIVETLREKASIPQQTEGLFNRKDFGRVTELSELY